VLEGIDCADLRFNVEAKGFTETAGQVIVQLDTATGEEQLPASFLVTAEGARSQIRKAAGIDYLGFTYDEKFLVASTQFPFEEVFDDLSWVNYVSDPDEWCVSALESLAGASLHSSRCKADLRFALRLNLEPHAPLR